MKIAVYNPWLFGEGTTVDGNEHILNNIWNESITLDDICEIVRLKEMINVRDWHHKCHVFTKDEDNMLIIKLCVK